MTTWTGTVPTFTAGDTTTVTTNLNTLRDALKATSEAWTAYTPTVTSQSGTLTTVSASGRYMRVNKLVNFQVSILITTAGSGAGGIRFTLPTSAHASAIFIGAGREMTSTGVMLFVLGNQLGGATLGEATRYDNATAIGSGRQYNLYGTYEAA